MPMNPVIDWPTTVTIDIPETTHDKCGGRALSWWNGRAEVWHCEKCGDEWPQEKIDDA